MIYFDNASSGLLEKEVLSAFNKYSLEFYANPSSAHNLGSVSLQAIEKAKRQILKELNIPDYNLVFTSGATEGNNFLIEGIARRNFKVANKIITSKIEHPSVIQVFKALEKEGFQVVYLDVDKYGRIDLNELSNAIDNKTSLVSVMAVNNEVGTVEPVSEISKIVRKYPHCYFMSDVTQGILKTDLDYSLIDAFSMSGHKIGGLKSSGFVAFKKRIDILPLIKGGEQQDGYRSGTLNAPLICSLATAMRIGLAKKEERAKKANELKQYLVSKFNEMPDLIEIVSPQEHCSPFILNFALLHHKASVVVEALSQREIYVTTRSSCSSKSKGGSDVILAMGYSESIAENCIRLSFNGTEEIAQGEEFVAVLKELLHDIRRRD